MWESRGGGGGVCGLIFGLGVGIKVRSGSHCEDGSQAQGNWTRDFLNIRQMIAGFYISNHPLLIIWRTNSNDLSELHKKFRTKDNCIPLDSANFAATTVFPRPFAGVPSENNLPTCTKEPVKLWAKLCHNYELLACTHWDGILFINW